LSGDAETERIGTLAIPLDGYRRDPVRGVAIMATLHDAPS